MPTDLAGVEGVVEVPLLLDALPVDGLRTHAHVQHATADDV